MEVSFEKEMVRSLGLFADAVEAASNLTIIGDAVTEEGDHVLVVKNSDLDEKIEGHQCTVEITEIVAKASNESRAEQFVDVISLDRKPLVLDGVTRIVGYYSRVNNWNKSKIGELRDRKQKYYAVAGHTPEHDEARHAVINNH